MRPLGLELLLELAVEDLLEDVLEAAVIDLEDGVLGREIDRVVAQQAVVQRGAGEVDDRTRRDCTSPCATPAPGALNTSFSIDGAVLADELHRQRALAGELDVGGAVLVAIGVAADDDRLGPARNQARHVLADDRLAEDDAAEDVADGAVRRLPHLLEAELLHPGLVRGDGGALDADADLLDRFGRVDGDLVVGLVAVFHARGRNRAARRRGYGWISLSLMYCQMIRVISSPSSSTTGLATLIFAMIGEASWEQALWRRGGNIRAS